MVASMTAIQESSAQGREDHQDHRRDRVPDQHPGPERRRRSGAGRRGGHGLRGGGRRGAEPGAAGGAGGPGHRGAHRGVRPPARSRAASRWSAWRRSIGQFTESVAKVKEHRRRRRAREPAAGAGHRPGVHGHPADGEGDADDRGDGRRERGGQRGTQRPGRDDACTSSAVSRTWSGGPTRPLPPSARRGWPVSGSRHCRRAGRTWSGCRHGPRIGRPRT